MGNNYTYIPLEFEEVYSRATALDAVFCLYRKQNDLLEDECTMDISVIGDIITRVDKRRWYFRIFHDETEISEVREVALYAYWIMKLKPLKYSSPEAKSQTTSLDLNEGFAMHIIFSTVRKMLEHKNDKPLNITETYMKKLLYAFKYWDLSKEALIILCETLYEIHLTE